MQNMQQQIMQLTQMLNNSPDPMAALRMMGQTNPNMAMALNMINSGTNPSQIFDNVCSNKGLDPQAMRQIFSQMGFRL